MHDNAPAHRARETVHLLAHETPTLSLQLCGQPTVLTLTSRLPDLGEATGACVPQPDSWRRPVEVAPDRRVGTFPPGGSSMKRSGSGVHVFEPAFEHRVDILNTDFRCADVLPFASHRRTLDSQSRQCLLDTYAFEWPY